ncbi:MAG: 2-isopropylmalate synthase [Deltaproteobacteria bacterium]|nr:2-isopropylmalate synthase [Deltaproteobacteria bacterium]
MGRKEPFHDVIYDWNVVDAYHSFADSKVTLLDETLRDGLQSSYVVNPSIDEKIELVRLMDSLGIEVANIGLPGAGDQAVKDCTAIIRAITDEGMSILPAVAARTHEDDILPAVEVSQATGVAVEVMSFIGSSPIRMLAEEWDLDSMLARSSNAISLARREGLPVTFVTEDTTRSRPDILYKLFNNAIDAGVQRLCLCDTTGHASPDGIRVLLRFVTNLIQGVGVDVGIDWHGHNDRGMAVANSIWAIQGGAERIHGCALGVGERSGNASMEQIIMNLRLLGAIGDDRPLDTLLDYCNCASRILRHPVPTNLPLAGRDAFRTQTGVHAAAIVKAQEKGDSYLADRVYSGVPAGMFGLSQEICVGPMSGASNVEHVLSRLGVPANRDAVDRVLKFAKSQNHILSDEEIISLIDKGRDKD